jgi:hemoglobin-like flavoprotein
MESLTARDCALVREHLDALVEREDSLPAFVYPRLFEKSPASERLFGRQGEGSQRRMLYDTIATVVDYLDDECWVSTKLEGVGSLHRHVYEVEVPMYGAFIDAVVEGIGEALGPSVTSAHARAWHNALSCITESMLAGGYPGA